MKRIYKSYGIRITDNSGAKLVKLNKNVDMSSFRNSQKVYSKTKKMYEAKNEDVTVELVGITQDNEIGNTIYSKQFIREVLSEDKVLLEKTDDLVSDIKNNLEILRRKLEYHQGMISVADKKQQVILHNIEDMKSMSDKDKLKLLSDLENIRKIRRFHKEERNKLSKLNSIVGLDNVCELFSKVEIPIEKEFEFLDKNKLEELNILKEVEYNGQKDKIHKMNELQKKFEKVIDNSAECILVCYNKAKKLK